jgi:predicted permease
MEILRQNPGFTAISLLLLTLGLGVLSAVLILDQGVVLGEPPFKDTSRLATLTGIFNDKGEVKDWGISHIDFLDWRQQSRAFEEMAAFSPGGMSFNLVADGQAEKVNGELVSYNYFAVLGGVPVLGRAFTPEEDGKPFTHPVTVLSHDLWQRRFGGDRGVVGRSVDLNGQQYTVVGVAPKGFHGISEKADAWIPSSMPPAPIYVANRRMRWLAGVARLKPGVALESAQKDMDRITAALEEKYPESNKGMGARLASLRDSFTAPLAAGLRLLTLGALLALLLAGINAANLLQNRLRAAAAAGEQQPSAGQAVAATVLLCLIGSVLGLALASWAVSKLAPVSGIAFPTFVRLTAGPAVIAGVLALAVVFGLAIGLAGHRAARAAGPQPARPTLGWRLFQGFAALAQIALAVVLAVNAGVMAKGYRQAVNRDHLGLQPENLLILRVDLQGPRYAPDEAVIEVVRRYLERLPHVPGVAALAIGGPTIPTDAWVGGYITIEDHASDTPAGTYPIMTHSVSPDYFKVMGIPILRGRGFTMADSGKPGTPFAVVVSRSMAEQQWPRKSPLGQRLKFGTRNTPDHPWLPVVGVAADVQHEGLMAEARPAPDLYMPILTSPIRLPTTLNFLVRPKRGVSTASLVPALEREIRAVTPDTPPYDAATMEERLNKQTQKGRMQVELAAFLAALLLALAVTGIYAAVADRRTPGQEVSRADRPALRGRAAL